MPSLTIRYCSFASRKIPTERTHTRLARRRATQTDAMSRPIVVVGAGNAAGYLVRALVAADPALGAKTLVLGAEDVAPCTFALMI